MKVAVNFNIKKFFIVEISINIKNEQADRLARELSQLTEKTITETVIKALSERL
ncbi:type II toxin-antitoxin system VapB family antitoxin [Myxosarcina sp. GI1(2024)]